MFEPAGWHHAENAQEIRIAQQNLLGLRAAFCLAEEMGTGLGAGEVLFRCLPQDQTLT
jgi:hypothetical protein